MSTAKRELTAQMAEDVDSGRSALRLEFVNLKTLNLYLTKCSRILNPETLRNLTRKLPCHTGLGNHAKLENKSYLRRDN